MKIQFLGAAKTVTGSCFYIETKGCKFLVDCGLFQGHSVDNEMNREEFPFDVSELDYILLTHAHIDHSGRIPKIFLDGFKGKVVTTKATAELCSIMLPDSGHIHEFEAEWKNRKRKRAGKETIKPLYTQQDAIECMQLFEKVRYNEVKKLSKNIKVRFKDAGHILGSAIIELWIMEHGKETKIVFSGDLGNRDIPILRDPSLVENADCLILESTYGNRLHRDNENKVEQFIDIVNETIDNGGNIIIPSFAVGRTQEIIYDLNKHKEKYGDKVNKLYDIPVFIDSPLAISATKVFRNNLDCYDKEARSYIEKGNNPLDFYGLQFTKTAEESKALNNIERSVIIISASGMCEAGRIKHHLKHNLWRRESSVIFVGYQAQGTLGRKLVDGTRKVKIFGEEISVNARIEMIDGFSGHADRDGLINWVKKINRKPENIFLVHGEEESIKSLSDNIRGKFGIETIVPERNESYVIKASKVATSIGETEKLPKFRRLEVLNMLDTLGDEFDELRDILESDLKKEKDDVEVEVLKAKLKNLEKSIVDVLR